MGARALKRTLPRVRIQTECNSVCRPAKVRKNQPLRAAKLTSAPSTVAHSYFIQPRNLMKWTGRTTLKRNASRDGCEACIGKEVQQETRE